MSSTKLYPENNIKFVPSLIVTSFTCGKQSLFIVVRGWETILVCKLRSRDVPEFIGVHQ